MDNFFISALVRAGSCQKHARHIATSSQPSPFTTAHHKARRKRNSTPQEGVRAFRTNKAHRGAAQAATVEPSRDELQSLLDFYEPDPLVKEVAQVPVVPEPEPDDPPRLQDLNAGTSHFAQPARDEAEQEAINELEELLENEESAHEAIYEAYKAISYPRVTYLSGDTLRRLLHYLSVVKHPTEASMLRYLSIADDMKAAGIPMTVSEWSSTIHFAGRCFRRVSSAEVESALYIWKEMESEAGVKGNSVTFNILFDIATKANKFVLAEMIMKEMQARNLRFNRYFRTSLIYYHGLRADGDAIRAAYKALVAAGEIVDTAVLNCVLSALLRAGEPAAAEHLFERMKRLHASRTTTTTNNNNNARPPPRDWRGARQLGRLLDRAGALLRDDAARRRDVQAASPVAPDAQTFALLVRHHTLGSGDLDRVTALLGQMAAAGIAPSGAVFLLLFRGFATHGGVRYGAWTRARLEGVWAAFWEAVAATTTSGEEAGARAEHGEDGVRVERAMVVAVLHAFARCAGRERTMEVWEVVRGRWEPKGAEELEGVTRLVGRLVPPGGD